MSIQHYEVFTYDDETVRVIHRDIGGNSTLIADDKDDAAIEALYHRITGHRKSLINMWWSFTWNMLVSVAIWMLLEYLI